MASNIKYPEDKVLYFIRGDHLGLITTYSSTGESRTDRKAYQGFDHSVTNGLLIHYYVKKCLYMDKAGTESEPGMAQVSMNLMMQHERKFDMAIKKYGTKKRSKTGGTRAVVPTSFT